jgi:hypothetical protein
MEIKLESEIERGLTTCTRIYVLGSMNDRLACLGVERCYNFCFERVSHASNFEYNKPTGYADTH